MLNERELHARYEIMVETYNKTVNVEGQLMVLMANRYILPAAFDVPEAGGAERVGGQGGRRQVGRGQEGARRLTRLTDEFKQRTDKLAKALDHEGNGAAEKHAKHFRDAVVPAMAGAAGNGGLSSSA